MEFLIDHSILCFGHFSGGCWKKKEKRFVMSFSVFRFKHQQKEMVPSFSATSTWNYTLWDWGFFTVNIFFAN